VSTTGLFKPFCKRGHPRTPDSLSANRTCKACTAHEARSPHGKQRTAAYGKKRRAKPEEQTKARIAARRFNLKKYGLTEEAYAIKLAEQGFGCAICGAAQKDLKRALAIDHNHVTGRTRGLLCPTCNSRVVFVAENLSHLFNRAVDYLRKYDVEHFVTKRPEEAL